MHQVLKNSRLLPLVVVLLGTAVAERAIAADSLAQPPPTPTTSPRGVSNASVPEPHQTAVTSERPLEIQLLERQFAITRDFQSDVLTTVYWSLGLIATLAILLVTYGWFSNFKIYERDKQALIAEITASAAAQISALQQAQRTALLDERTRAEKATSQLRGELRTRIDQAIADQSGAAETARKSLKEYVDGRFKAFDEYVGNHLKLVKLRIFGVQREMADINEKWSALITHSLNELEAALDLEGEFFIEIALRALERAIDMRGAFSAAELEKLPALLAQVPPKLATLRDSVSKKLASAERL